MAERKQVNARRVLGWHRKGLPLIARPETMFSLHHIHDALDPDPEIEFVIWFWPFMDNSSVPWFASTQETADVVSEPILVTEDERLKHLSAVLCAFLNMAPEDGDDFGQISSDTFSQTWWLSNPLVYDNLWNLLDTHNEPSVTIDQIVAATSELPTLRCFPRCLIEQLVADWLDQDDPTSKVVTAILDQSSLASGDLFSGLRIDEVATIGTALLQQPA